MREDPSKVLLIAPVVLLGLLLCYVAFHSLVLLAVALFLLSSALAEYLFPIRYELDERGACARTALGRTFVEWDRVKRYYLDDRGIKLSTLDKPGRLESYRGLYLRFGGHREEVSETVRRLRDAKSTVDRTEP